MAKVEFFVDGKSVQAEEGTRLLDAILEAGIYVPHICSHPDLESRGGCKLCVVEVEGVEGVVTSCTQKVTAGLKVTTKSSKLDEVRRTSMQLMLGPHPADCGTCKSFGKCELQALMQYVNAFTGRYRHYTRNKLAVNSKNPLIVREMERCIQCGRCIRVCHDVRGVGIMRQNKEGFETYIGTENDIPYVEADCRFCGACIEVCPTGSLTDVEGIFRTDIPKNEALKPCSAQCPAHIDIPAYIRLVKEGKPDQAVAVIREKVPFPHALGLVCAHGCEGVCKHNGLNDAVSIRNLKRYACENDTTELWKEKSAPLAPATGKKVAVVGGGAAGMTAALYLAKKGHDVTVFEKKAKAGGYMQYGIPAYRLPKEEVVQKEINDILAQGVKLETNAEIKSLDELQGFDAIAVTAGTSAGKKISVPGCEIGHSKPAVEFLYNIINDGEDADVKKGTKLIVLGGGNVAFDVARTAARLGAEVNLFCLEARDVMLADEEEIEGAQEEGVTIHPGTTNLEVMGTADKLEGLRYADITGFKFGPNGLEVDIVPDTEKVQEGDFIIYALGQRVDLASNFGLEVNRFGFPTVEEGTHRATGKENVFLGGDVITGTKFVITAIAEGREVAIETDLYLGGDGNINEKLLDREKADPNIGLIEGFAKIPRQQLNVVPVEERANNFNQVDAGFTAEQANCEATRCLQCDLRCDFQRTKFWGEY